MSDAMSEMYRSMRDDEERSAALDAACFALAAHLQLTTKGRESWETLSNWNRDPQNLPRGFARVVNALLHLSTKQQELIDLVVALEKADAKAWQGVLKVVDGLLGFETSRLRGGKKAERHVAWARLLRVIDGTRWAEDFLAASPFAGHAIMFTHHHADHDGERVRMSLAQGFDRRATAYLEKLAAAQGHVHVLRNYMPGTQYLFSTDTFLAVPLIPPVD